MVRGVDNNGCLIIGLTRSEIDRLVRGERVCSNAAPPAAPGPHLCIYFGETDDAILRAMRDNYPRHRLPPIDDRRGEPGWDEHREPEGGA